MKKQFTLFILAAATALSTRAQLVLSEDFTEPAGLASKGWTITNNSVPTGSLSWTQGNQTGGNGTVTAYNGSTDDFYMADFMSVTFGQAGGISAWLITPPVTIYNGANLEFATRTFPNTTIYPDRMQVRMSKTNNAVVPSGTTSVGSFTDLLFDINPNLTMNTTSVVNNGTVNGYPQQWTVYSINVTGVTGTVTGRFAFRYFVDDAGSNGTNSRLVAVDAVRYKLPCGSSVASYTICPGVSATLTAEGSAPATTFTWSTASNNSSIVVTPGSTTVYSLMTSAGTVLCGPPLTATVTVANGLNVQVTATPTAPCAGSTATLTASSAGNQYFWLGPGGPMGSNPTVTVNPQSTTTYSVGALSGGCTGSTAITLSVTPYPTPTVVVGPACLGGSVTITMTGADSYVFLGDTTNPKTIATPTAAGSYTFGYQAINNGACSVFGQKQFTVYAPPVVTTTVATPVACTNETVIIRASGADTYAWSGGGTGTIVGVPTKTITGIYTLTVTGTDGNGCTDDAIVQFSVGLCPGISEMEPGQQVSVFPNPFTNELRVNDLDGQVELYNSLGQRVLLAPVKSGTVLNVSNIANGTYILKAYNAEGNVVQYTKLIKN